MKNHLPLLVGALVILTAGCDSLIDEPPDY